MSTSPFPLNPGNNPTGMQYPVPGSSTPTSGVSTANPYVSPTSNPYAPNLKTATPGTSAGGIVPGATGAFPANTSPYSSTKNIPSPLSGSLDLNAIPDDQLQNIFGPTAPLIKQLLGTGGGYNQQAVNAILAQMQPGIQAGEENLMEQFGAAGGRFSSGAQLGLADYLSQVQLNQGDIMANMYETSYQNLMNEIMGLTGPSAQYQASRPTTWDIISGILGMGTKLGAAGIAACYVAAELYGGWNRLETIAIRRWLFNTWQMRPFVWVYERIGPRWARWIRANRHARRMTKILFDWFLSHAQR